ncbi:hypothetical protein UNSWDHB_913 [Dehalobacter sp. UNSWDHB]|nr:hypothetical protein DHBDCA_p1549 [Dehalobacter sp. DCA]EQB21709.1 hypothetical protein UNSWDHB_913 [Dehalobacter sp. UNSWDHB]
MQKAEFSVAAGFCFVKINWISVLIMSGDVVNYETQEG